MPSRALSLVQHLVYVFLFTSVYNAIQILATPILVAAPITSGPTITTVVSGAGHLPVEIRQISPTTISPFLPGQTISSTSPSSASISDGGGTGYSPVSIIWIVFAILLALPLSTAGVRGYKITSGAGIGLSLALLIWVTFVNSTTSGAELSTKSQNTSDLFLSLVIWVMFVIGSLGGLVRVGFLVGMNLLGACAGTALGILIVLLRPGLLVPIYAVNIVPIALLTTGGLLWPLWHQRLAVIVSSSTCGAFFIALATDLSLNKQSGISAGLRFLLDRNKAHITITLQTGYKPKISTLIIIGVSLALIPAFSFLQHKIWKGPFDRSESSMEKWKIKTNGAPIIGPGEDGFVSKDAKEEETAKPKVRFPSIIPTLPGNVPAPLPTRGNDKSGKVVAGGGGYNGDGGVPIGGIVSPVYLAQQAEFQKNPPMPMQTVPGAGIGRLGFVGYWSNVGSNFAKRVSKRLSGAGGKRFSQMSAPSVYSMDVNQNGNPNNGGRGWGWKPQPANAGQRPQQPGGYGGPSSSSNQRFVPARDETPGSVYGGMQVPQTKPLQLPNRVAQQQQPPRAAPAPYNNGNNNWGQQQQQRQNVKPTPPASLRTGRWNDVSSSRPPITPTTPSSSSRQAFPTTPQRQQQQQPMLLPSQLQRQQSSQNQRQQPASSPQVQQAQGNRNRLKPSTRYNLL